MSYSKLNQLVIYLRMFQEKDLDVLAITSSPKGFGKSSLIIQASRRYVELFGLICIACGHEWIYEGKVVKAANNLVAAIASIEIDEIPLDKCPKCKGDSKRIGRFNFKRYLAYDNEEVLEKVHDLPGHSPILCDEGVRFMMGEDWNTWESKRLKKLFAQMRTKHMLVFANIPKFNWVDRKYRDDMCTFWIRILKRGLALLFQPDLGEGKDPWHMKELEEQLGSYNYFTSEEELMKRVEKIMARHPCAFDFFKVPPVPEDIYADYLKARNAKAFERSQLDASIDQREIGKIVAYNLLHKWQQIEGAVKAGRFEKPTLQLLEQFVFSNPKDEQPIARYTTIRNWVKEIEDVMKR